MRLLLQRVAAAEPDLRARDREREFGKLQTSAAEDEPATKIRRDLFRSPAARVVRALSGSAPTIFCCTSSFVNRAAEISNRPFSLSRSTTSASPGGSRNFVVSFSAADHGRLRRPDGHDHDVLEPRLRHLDVEADRASLAGRAVKDRASCDERRLEKVGVDPLEPRVAVRAVHDRVVLRVKRKRMAADVDDEIRRVGFSVDVDPAERAVERSARRQRAADSFEDAEIGVVERERAVERRATRFVTVPRAERPRRHDLSGRDAVGERRVVRARRRSRRPCASEACGSTRPSAPWPSRAER